MLHRLASHVPSAAKVGVLGALLSTVLAGWLLAAPPGASPDDGYHLGSIWCAEGFKDDICVEAPAIEDPRVAFVPSQVLTVQCFAYDGARSAACQNEAFENTLVQLLPSVTNLDKVRPNFYYWTMHQLIGDGQDVAAAAGRIRAANALLTVGMVTLTALVAHRRLRAAFLLSWLVAALPLGLFFATTVSTSAWSVAGLTTVWANLITVRDHPDRRHRMLGALLAVIGAGMGLGARTEAVAHVAVLVTSLAAMWWFERRRNASGRRSLPRRLAGAAGALVALLMFFGLLDAVAPESANLSGAVGGFAEGYERLEARDVGDPFLAILFEVPTLWSGALGDAWGLGVLDTPIPHIASIPTMALFVALLAIGIHRGSRGRTLAIALLAAALIAMPTLSLLRSGLLVYESLQPRQFMAMVYPILGLALYRSRREPTLVLDRTMRITAVLTLSAAHAIALLVTMQRHTIGLLPGFDGLPRHVQLGRDIEWWWSSMPHPDVVWAIASIAFLALVAGSADLFRERGSGEQDDGRKPHRVAEGRR